MDNIKDQIRNVCKFPNLTSNLMMNSVIDMEYAASAVRTRQTIRLTMEEFRNLMEIKDVLFYESDKAEIDDLDSIDLDDSINLSDIRDAFSISEYVGGHEKYIVHPYYIKYVTEHNEDVMVTIYNGEDLFDINRRPSIIRDRVDLHSVLSVDKAIVLKQHNFKQFKSMHYTSFGTETYESGLLIPSLQDPIHVLCIDIPYNYYRYQPLHPSVYNWDIDKNKHVFGDMNSDEFNAIYEDILKNGIKDPIFLRMNGEVLSAVDIKDNIILFIAKLLKIPSVPAVVYLSNEDTVRNHLVDAMVDRDESLQNVICKSTEYMVNMFEPYILLYREEDPNSAFVRTSEKEYSIAFYKLFSDIGHMKVRYFDKLVDPDMLENNEKKILEVQSNLEKEANSKLEDDIQKVIDSLMSNNGSEVD